MIHQTLAGNDLQYDEERPTYTTPNGKVLEIYATPHGLYGFRFKTGGELPKFLQSRFTHRPPAAEHAEKYIKMKEEEAEAKKLAIPRKTKTKKPQSKEK